MTRKFKNALRAFLISLGLTSSRRALWVAAGLALLTQLALISQRIGEVAEHRAVIGATDNDAGVAVDIAVGTKLYDDNNWRAYGPVYYRFVRVLSLLSESRDHSPERSPRENVERLHHRLLLWTSVLSLFLLCYLIARRLTADQLWQWIATSWLLTAFLQDRTWAEMLLRAHPDHVFALTVAAAFTALVPAARRPFSRRRWFWAGGALGIAAATKMTISLFLPAFVLGVFLFDLKNGERRSLRASGITVLVYLGGALASYLTVGFPQSFNFGGVIEFLVSQSANILPGTRESLLAWLQLFWAQFQIPLLVFLAIAAIVPTGGRTSVSRSFGIFSARARLALLFLLPFLPVTLLFSRKIISPFSWYPLPFIAAIFICWGTVRRSWGAGLLDIYPRLSPWVPLLALFAPSALGFGISSRLDTVTIEQHRCRPEALTVQKKVDLVARRGGHVLADPLIPYSNEFHDREVEMAWEMNLSRIRAATKMVALKRDYYLMYLPVTEGGLGVPILHIKDLEPVRAFYRAFESGRLSKDFQAENRVDSSVLHQAVTPDGATFALVHTDGCGFELWQRVPSGGSK